ncbi:12101_t:CDS:2 [Dentiscutata erythropus]|uniref:12101_t:CDS:1 n=1 Tax=Dentiscutata erythropus TaxID=1348616 RepID=A0A9N9HYA2_9GLOM|nr:12101_t:CDS:2 [Dentiscutata erythropus]
MPTRWLQNDLWECLDLVSKEPFIGLSSLIQHRVQRKLEYGRLIENFKKALNYSIEDNNQKNLNELILTYIAKKERKREAEALSVIIENPVPNNIVKLADDRIYNADNIKDPVVRQGKNRQATKCLKAFTEENSKAATSNMKHTNISNEEKGVEVIGSCKCRLCHETGHYAPKCPNRED